MLDRERSHLKKRDKLIKLTAINPIVLDKSYLQGTGTTTIQAMLETRCVLMPSVLFYELMSTSEPGRSRCFAKIPTVETPLCVITDIDVILHSEFESHLPYGELLDYVVDAPYVFNPKFKKLSVYEFTSAERRLLEQWENYFSKQVELLGELMGNISLNFPKLHDGATEERILKYSEIEEKIVGDSDVVLFLYDAIWQPGRNQPSWPAATAIDSSWAIYRWVQAKLLFTLDSCAKYNGALPVPMSRNTFLKFEHDMIDLEYLVHGVLQGAFATKDVKLQRWFQMLRPEGELLS